jgi:hypothetical protein
MFEKIFGKKIGGAKEILTARTMNDYKQVSGVPELIQEERTLAECMVANNTYDDVTTKKRIIDDINKLLNAANKSPLSLAEIEKIFSVNG